MMAILPLSTLKQMTRSKAKLVLGLVAGLLLSSFMLGTTAFAAEADKPSSFTELLQQAEAARTSSKKINQQREAEFKNARNDQAALLKKAQQELAAAKQRSETLRQEFTDNQTKIAEAKTSLEAAKGDLSGVFSAARDASGGLQATIAGSLLAIDQQTAFQQLSNISAQGNAALSPADLSQLGVLLLQTAIATGEVVSFPTEVVQPSGERRENRVVRVGVFNAISGRRFLEHIADINSLQVLTRQPSATETELANNFANSDTTDSDNIMLIDPTRGNLLSALVNRPEIEERIEQGGVVGYVIIGVGLLGVLIILLRLMSLLVSGIKIWRQRRRLDQLSKRNSLGRVLLAADHAELLERDHENLELLLDEAVLRETPHLQRGLPILKLLAAVAPLLGLLGTVVGMIETFYDISIYGNGDPKLMADGISQALVTTMLGLIVAIPLLGSYTLLWLLSNRLIHTLDQESAGLLVRHFEAQKHHADAGMSETSFSNSNHADDDAT